MPVRGHSDSPPEGPAPAPFLRVEGGRPPRGGGESCGLAGVVAVAPEVCSVVDPAYRWPRFSLADLTARRAPADAGAVRGLGRGGPRGPGGAGLLPGGRSGGGGGRVAERPPPPFSLGELATLSPDPRPWRFELGQIRAQGLALRTPRGRQARPPQDATSGFHQSLLVGCVSILLIIIKAKMSSPQRVTITVQKTVSQKQER